MPIKYLQTFRAKVNEKSLGSASYQMEMKRYAAEVVENCPIQLKLESGEELFTKARKFTTKQDLVQDVTLNHLNPERDYLFMYKNNNLKLYWEEALMLENFGTIEIFEIIKLKFSFPNRKCRRVVSSTNCKLGELLLPYRIGFFFFYLRGRLLFSNLTLR